MPPKSKSQSGRSSPERCAFSGIQNTNTSFVNLRDGTSNQRINCGNCGDKTIVNCASEGVQEAQPGCRALQIRRGLADKKAKP